MAIFDRAFTDAPTGTTLVATAGNDQDFDFFAQLLTNAKPTFSASTCARMRSEARAGRHP